MKTILLLSALLTTGFSFAQSEPSHYQHMEERYDSGRTLTQEELDAFLYTVLMMREAIGIPYIQGNGVFSFMPGSTYPVILSCHSQEELNGSMLCDFGHGGSNESTTVYFTTNETETCGEHESEKICLKILQDGQFVFKMENTDSDMPMSFTGEFDLSINFN